MFVIFYLQNTLSAIIFQSLTSDSIATFVGAIIGALIGGVLGYIGGAKLENLKDKNKSKRDHYTDIKKECLNPLYENLCSIYKNNFDYGHHTKKPNPNLKSLGDRIQKYFEILNANETKTFLHYRYIGFELREQTPKMNKLLYDDLYIHFPDLKDQLGKCEEFIDVEGYYAESLIFDIAQNFVYKNKEYNVFVKKIIAKNSQTPEQIIRLNYFIFAVLVLLTSNDVAAKKYVPKVLDLSGVEDCLRILEPYLGNERLARPHYSYDDKNKLKSNNEKIEQLWELYEDANKLFYEVLRAIDFTRHAYVLPGKDCGYVKLKADGL